MSDITTTEARRIVEADGRYKVAYDIGVAARRAGRLKDQTPDRARLHELAGSQFAFRCVLGNAWFAGYESVSIEGPLFDTIDAKEPRC